ncbi:MAG: flagellar basal body P-ring formation chaperone FlgA [Gammaproteobacteria bacterium]|nr:MAG: flagellar basal body P-ring formation chaperone FlgA [Gammaproteobacteria bacterium]
MIYNLHTDIKWFLPGLMLCSTLFAAPAVFATSMTAAEAPSAAMVVSGDGFQSLHSIRQIVEEFLHKQLDSKYDDVEISIGQLGPRLKLAPCPERMQPFLHAGARLRGYTTVGVRCTNPNWKLYVSANIKIFKDVLIARRPLARGMKLSGKDFILERRDINTLYTGYITDLNDVIGKVLKRPLVFGKAVNPLMIESPNAVRRGQRITILAGNKRFSVRMPGKALSDGKPGQIIRVKNLSSKRIIEGTVTYEGYVRVRL